MKPEDGGSMDLCNVGILPQHYTVSELRKTRIFTAVKTSNIASRQKPIFGNVGFFSVREKDEDSPSQTIRTKPPLGLCSQRHRKSLPDVARPAFFNFQVVVVVVIIIIIIIS
jgi:hypothetical protein